MKNEAIVKYNSLIFRVSFLKLWIMKTLAYLRIGRLEPVGYVVGKAFPHLCEEVPA